MLAIVKQSTKNRKNLYGLDVVVVAEIDILYPTLSEYDSKTNRFSYTCSYYYGIGNEIIKGTRGDRFTNIINLNKTMGEMQEDGSI
jgi:hypothetical protein